MTSTVQKTLTQAFATAFPLRPGEAAVPTNCHATTTATQQSGDEAQSVEMGTRNNQNFVQIPHARFIDMLTYKAELVGVRVILTEESYTSKASFLDLDPLPVRDPGRTEEPKFSGRRVKRGLYRASGNRYMNADVNGAYNILRKGKPDAFNAKGVAGYVVHPVRMTRTKSTGPLAL